MEDNHYQLKRAMAIAIGLIKVEWLWIRSAHKICVLCSPNFVSWIFVSFVSLIYSLIQVIGNVTQQPLWEVATPWTSFACFHSDMSRSGDRVAFRMTHHIIGATRDLNVVDIMVHGVNAGAVIMVSSAMPMHKIIMVILHGLSSNVKVFQLACPFRPSSLVPSRVLCPI